MVTVPGDVGQIDAGDTNLATPAVKSLHLGSLGVLTTTQAGTPSYESLLMGSLTSLEIDHDLAGTLLVQGNALSKIGSAHIHGSVLGGATDDSGELKVQGGIDTLLVDGNISGGEGLHAGSITAGGLIRSATIGGNIMGCDGIGSGLLTTTGDLFLLNIGGSVSGEVNATSLGENGQVQRAQDHHRDDHRRDRGRLFRFLGVGHGLLDRDDQRARWLGRRPWGGKRRDQRTVDDQQCGHRGEWRKRHPDSRRRWTPQRLGAWHDARLHRGEWRRAGRRRHRLRRHFLRGFNREGRDSRQAHRRDDGQQRFHRQRRHARRHRSAAGNLRRRGEAERQRRLDGEDHDRDYRRGSEWQRRRFQRHRRRAGHGGERSHHGLGDRRRGRSLRRHPVRHHGDQRHRRWLGDRRRRTGQRADRVAVSPLGQDWRRSRGCRGR